MPRKPRENGVLIGEQLWAIRQALKWRRSSSPKDPMVRLYVELRETNPREVVQQWERLEREHRANNPLVQQPKAFPVEPILGSAPVVPAVVPVLVRDDGYDPLTDAVTPKVLGMIDRWLAGCRARAEARASGQLEPALDVEDDVDIPG